MAELRMTEQAAQPIASSPQRLRESARLGRWRFASSQPAPLSQVDALLHGELTTVKQGARRTVYRIEGPHDARYLKLFQPGPWWRRWLAAWLPSPAEREWTFAQRLAAQGVDTPAALAWFDVSAGPRRGSSGLITAALAGAVSVDRLASRELPAREKARLRRRLADALLSLMVRAHRAGFEHGDLHAGNLLASEANLSDASRPLRLFVIDFASSRQRSAMGPRHARADLVRLAASFRQWATEAALRRFVRGYLAARGELAPADALAWIDHVQVESRKLSARIARRRDRRAWQANREFAQPRGAWGQASLAAELDPAGVEGVLRDPLGWLARYVHAPLKLGTSSRVLKAEFPDAAAPGGRRPVVVKQMQARRFWQTPWAWWARRRARRAWQTAAALHARGLPVARPLALVLPRRGPAAYLISEYVAGAVNLHLFAWELARLPAQDRARLARQTADELGRLVGGLHAWGIAHRDLKGCNLMVVREGDRLRTPLVDLDGVVVRRWLSRCERVRNLARLTASVAMHDWIGPALRYRFLRAYARELHGGAGELRALARDVAHATRRVDRRRKRRNAAVG